MRNRPPNRVNLKQLLLWQTIAQHPVADQLSLAASVHAFLGVSRSRLFDENIILYL